jgi:hypothetical protein
MIGKCKMIGMKRTYTSRRIFRNFVFLSFISAILVNVRGSNAKTP